MKRNETNGRLDGGAFEPSFGITDAYFILFRRKWVVLGFALLGCLAAGFIWKTQPPAYQSQAKVLVRYLVENRSVDAIGNDSPARTVDMRPDAESVVNSEAQILGSFDLAKEVADAVGPEKILPQTSKGDPRTAAANVIRGSLKIETPKSGNVITVRCRHPNPEVPPLVLQQLIEAYFRKHKEIHRAAGAVDEFLTQQIDQIRLRLTATEGELKKAKATAGVSSIEDAKKTYAEFIAKTRQEIFVAEADLAQRGAALAEIRKQIPTNASPQPAIKAPIAQSKIDEYRNACLDVEFFQKRDREFSTSFTAENPLVMANRGQLDKARLSKERLEKENPGLLLIPTTTLAGDSRTAIADGSAQFTEIVALQAKIAVLTNQLAQIRSESRKVEEVESEITDLQRRRALEEGQYIYFTKTLEQARFDQVLGSGKLTNIKVVESPLPSSLDSAKLYKMILAALGGGVGVGIALAVLLEMVIDRSLRRSRDVETFLPLPLFLSIPKLRLKSGASERGSKGLIGSSNPAGQTAASADMSPSPWADGGAADGLRLYANALRDRLINFFELRQMTHKPKLVGVTGCLPGAGVTSVATGLAAALSETGDGNVLLVDMKGESASAHTYCRGKPSCGLQELLEDKDKSTALVQDNLYFASAGHEEGGVRRGLPRQFGNLVPKLKASDYDYIIFDLPPVNQTSATGRIARFMDMMFLVVEAERTDREFAQKACQILEDSKVHATVVMNKYRSHVPKWLHREFQ